MAELDSLLSGMLEEKGSDLHIKVGHPIRIRVSGDLAPLDMEPLDADTVTRLLREICPPAQWQHFLESNDLDFAYEVPGVARFRSNYLCDYMGMGAVFRVIPSKILSAEELGLPEAITRICHYRDGLVFVTGPTGSGKSTTMAAMIDYINRHMCKKIITVEDPIEFVHQNRQSVIIHREVGEHCETFANALRSAMKGNPDIVLLGEMRELETIRLALNCASMGMLVFGTLHTNSAPKTIDRIIDAFPADEQPQIRILLSESLAAVVSQLLCKRGDQPGRVAAHEILVKTDALPNTIREGQISSIRTIIDGGGSEGMVSMDTSLERLLLSGKIDAEEAYMKALNKEHFLPYLEQNEEEDEDADEEHSG